MLYQCLFPVRFSGDMDLEPCALPRLPGLGNRHPGDGKDFAGQKKPPAGMLAKPALEDPLLVGSRNAGAIVFNNEDAPFSSS